MRVWDFEKKAPFVFNRIRVSDGPIIAQLLIDRSLADGTTAKGTEKSL